MSWKQLATRLEAEQRRFADVELDQPMSVLTLSADELVERMRKREQAVRATVDAAVRLYARHGSWPDISSDERFFVARRLYYGRMVADSIASSESVQRMLPGLPSDNEEGMLEWLLVDMWATLGNPLWIQTQGQYYAGAAMFD